MPEGSEFQTLVDNITNVRAEIADTLFSISVEQGGLAIAENNFAIAEASGQATSDIQQTINGHLTAIDTLNGAYTDLLATEQGYYGQLIAYYPTQQDLVANLDDHYPILFFPVRIETTFVTAPGEQEQLWVRIFPDDIAVQTHEPVLTDNEIAEGYAYWARYNAAANQLEKTQAWNLLCASFSHQRAAWIVLQTATTVTNQKLDSWSAQPFTQIMPDAFVVKAYSYSGSTFTVQTNNIPDKVKMGIDPQNDTVFDQVGGDLTAHPDVEWMIDFDAAIAKGLGVKINIDYQSSWAGFARIIVLGVKVSLTKEASQARLEQLIDSHHYTDGFSLLKQGTSVNNTDTEVSGYSSKDFGNKITQATEREANLFTPALYNIDKRDGQILCEALGIEYDPLYHIYQSDGVDIHNAMNINNALWASTWGYYLTNMMCPAIDGDAAEQLRSFFVDYVYCRGALPSIRSGIQPYGILPTTVYSRMVWDEPSVCEGVYEVTSALSTSWKNIADGITLSGNEGLSDVLATSPISVNRVFRIGLGSGFIWNNLVYSRPEESPQNRDPENWYNGQKNFMNMLESDTGLDLKPRPRVAQMNFLDTHFSVEKPLVAPDYFNKKEPLPQIGDGLNYLSLLGQATFEQLKYADYGEMGVTDVPDISILYLMTRQSLMLEYFTAACNILNIPAEQRIDPEFINTPTTENVENADAENFQFYAGTSRWNIMKMPYEGYGTISEFLDSANAEGFDLVANLFSAKNSVMQLSEVSIGDLELLTAEVMDGACFRLDTWKLSVINERLNRLRGITDGSSSRTKGIYIGAYSWVEDVMRKGNRTFLAPNEYPSSNFTGPIEVDSSNHGFIHAPSISQAAAAAVLRSGYMTRAEANSSSPLSVNISSERVRYAMQILEGIRNGQALAVLLGYEFERRLQDNYPYATSPVLINTARHLYSLRNKYPLSDSITAYSSSSNVEDIKARSVIDGVAIVNEFKANGLANIISGLGTTSAEDTAIQNEIEWIWNLMDAVADLSTAEGVFQLIQGNQTKSGGVTDAVSRGSNISDPELVNTPKTGTPVYQRFTMHFDNTLPATYPAGWSSTATPRAEAEPYMNKWAGEILGNPASIKCKVQNTTTSSDTIVTAANLNLQPIDFVLMIGNNLSSDDSELSSRIKKFVRDAGADKTDELEILYDFNNASGGHTFFQVFPVLQYLKKIITGCRHLKTQDYLVPNEADGIDNKYDVQEFFDRVDAAASDLSILQGSLATANGSFAISSSASDYENIRNILFNLAAFGVDSSIYEFSVNPVNDSADFTALKNLATAVNTEVSKRITKFAALSITDPTSSYPSNEEDFVNLCLDGLKIIFGRDFNALPRFNLNSVLPARSNLNYLVNNNLDTLLADHSSPNPVNRFVLDEWVCSIAKVRKNSANYEMLSMLASGINMASFTTDRTLVPMQVPFATGDKWLGANVLDADDVKQGRVSFGVSIPKLSSGIFDITADGQVGIMIDEWVDVIPNRDETTGVAFHFNQPNNKAPQCLLLGITPNITGSWSWTDIEDMINETFDFAKQRAITYEVLSQANNSVTQLASALTFPMTTSNSTIGLTMATLTP